MKISINTIYKFAAFSLLVIVGICIKPQPVYATCTGIPGTGNVTLNGAICTVSSVTGIDNAQNSESSTTNTGQLTLSGNTSITINSTGQFNVGSIVMSGGSIAIATGGKITPKTPLYVSDADGDGFAKDFTLYSATASGRRRLSLMQSVTTADCNDASSNPANSCIVTAGPLSPQTMADDATVGTNAWTTPNNAKLNDTIATYAKNGKTENSIKIVKGGVISGTDKSTGSSWLMDANWTTKSYGGSSDLWGITWTPADINSSTFGMVWSGINAGAITHYLKATNFGFSIPAGATINGILVTVRGDYLATYSSGNIDYIQITVYYSP